MSVDFPLNIACFPESIAGSTETLGQVWEIIFYFDVALPTSTSPFRQGRHINNVHRAHQMSGSVTQRSVLSGLLYMCRGEAL